MLALARPASPPRLVLSPDDDALLAARATVRFQLRAFVTVLEDARAGDVEGVHQLRVATRRLRAALRLFRPLLGTRFVTSVHDDLVWLADLIGAVRDRDVLFAALKARATDLDPTLRKAFGPVGIVLHDERAGALAALEAALDDERCRRMLQRLGAFVDGETGPRRRQRLGDVVPGLVEPLVRSVRRAGKRVRSGSPPGDFHRLRVRVKRLRYALETVRALGGKPVRRLLAKLVELQEVLGEAQDAITQTAWLRRYATTSGVRVPSLLPVGAVVQALARRGTKRRQRGLGAWRKLERGKLFEDSLHEVRLHVRDEARQARTA